jgi:hypothetical protein
VRGERFLCGIPLLSPSKDRWPTETHNLEEKRRRIGEKAEERIEDSLWE